MRCLLPPTLVVLPIILVDDDLFIIIYPDAENEAKRNLEICPSHLAGRWGNRGRKPDYLKYGFH